MHKNTPNYNSNSQFLATWVTWGGPWGDKMVFGLVMGVFQKLEFWFFFKCLVLVHYKVLGG